MYVFVQNNQVLDIERRDINLAEYYHVDMVEYFIQVAGDADVQIGDIYMDGMFSRPAPQLPIE